MDIEKMLNGNHLATLQVLYYLPDHPDLLQSFLWQVYDLPPEFPRILKFLEFWSGSIEGRLHSVKIVVAGHLVVPSARMVDFYGHID